VTRSDGQLTLDDLDGADTAADPGDEWPQPGDSVLYRNAHNEDNRWSGLLLSSVARG